LTTLIETIRDSLTKDSTDRNRKMWAKHFAEESINLVDLFKLLLDDEKASERCLWLFGDLSEIKPELLHIHLENLFKFYQSTNIRGFDRSLAKWFMNCGIPENIEGEITDQLFKWLTDLDTDVSVKNYSMTALYNLTTSYPDIRNELLTTLKHQMPNQPVSFVKRAQSILKNLEK
jgi:hypothetical protein